ncbi:hypothetical protein ABZ070_20885 [Streptomyces sp. NPDC006283]|uniref:hypothetical protein n=1 Tax=Streptomyces sp. NPDC006283 TaxID=3156741 RepID=UPI0033AC142E
MTVIRRLALYVALPLALASVAGYGWYQLSDTGRRWRYEDRLATYCQGLIPSKESAVLTDYDAEKGLPNDRHHGGSDGYEFCWVGKTMLTIAWIPASARDDDGPRGVFDELRPDDGEALPLALGGGWRGYTNHANSAVVLGCGNQDASVVVSSSGVGRAVAGRATAELVAATAVRAAEHWDCDAEAGGAIPSVPQQPEEKSRFEAEGTCEGIPMQDMDIIHWIKETPAAGTSPLESCVLGETKARAEELFRLSAHFGPYAQAQYPDSGTARGAGGSKDHFWATAKCSGSAAYFAVHATEYVHVDDQVEDFTRSALTAFAKRSAGQHGCTDLKLPR